MNPLTDPRFAEARAWTVAALGMGAILAAGGVLGWVGRSWWG